MVTWEEFKIALWGHHIPEGLLERKLNEFLALMHGNHIVLQYAHAFNNLCQYVGYHANTDAKKRDCFWHGISTKLKEWLDTVRAKTYNDLVNLAISQEDCIIAHRAKRRGRFLQHHRKLMLKGTRSCSTPRIEDPRKLNNKVVGLFDRLSSKAVTVSQISHPKAPTRMFPIKIARGMETNVLPVEALITMQRNALRTGRSKDKFRIRTKARSRWYKSGREGSTSLHSLTYRRELQWWWVFSLSET